MSNLTPDDAAAARVRATINALSATQPQVADWPAGVRQAVNRRRARRAAAATTGAVLALAVLVAGTAGALTGGPDELVAAPADSPSPSARPETSATASPAGPAPTTAASPSRAPSTRPELPASPTPPPSPVTTPSPAEPKLPSCGPAPAPTDGDVVLTLRFPDRVEASTVGVLRVTNRGDRPVTMTINGDETAFAVREGQIVSTGGSSGMAQAPTTLAPGEHREVRVRVMDYLCDGKFDGRLPKGTYEVQSTLWLDQKTRAVSPPVRITYAGEAS
jgi:hypothetical protein